MRTSVTHPLQIAVIPVGRGTIGVTFCPGKKDPHALTGAWDRDLALDITAIRDWGADVVLTLIEDHELALLQVENLGHAITEVGMQWLHLPIQDVSIPGEGFEIAWAEHGEALRRQLNGGGKVLVHCRGGLGRAGTIAAKLLVDAGITPATAIDMVRRVRKGAIETREQERYVLACRPLSPATETPGGALDPVADRAVGCLLGLAIGDAVGTTLEFKQRDSYQPLTDMVGGGPFRLKPGEWTDDTSMSLCLADSLIACGALNEQDVMERFVRWWERGENSVNGRCFDIGVTTAAALGRFKRTGNPIAGSVRSDSAGNGSIMRLAPVILRWHSSPTIAVAAARAQSRTTHGAPAAVEGCAALADILLDAVSTGDKQTVLRPRSSADPSIATVVGGSWRDKERSAISSSGYVVHTLEAALWVINRAIRFEDAVLMAANLGGDADTVAAVTGQIAGALWGRSAIPARWLDKLAWRSEIERRAIELVAAARKS